MAKPNRKTTFTNDANKQYRSATFPFTNTVRTICNIKKQTNRINLVLSLKTFCFNILDSFILFSVIYGDGKFVN